MHEVRLCMWGKNKGESLLVSEDSDEGWQNGSVQLVLARLVIDSSKIGCVTTWKWVESGTCPATKWVGKLAHQF